MKKIATLVMVLCVYGQAKSGLYAMKTKGPDGKEVDLGQYEGKVTLVVNTASKCGYTPQYKDLQALSDKYAGKGLVVLGFPSNDFGGQEPGSNAEIKKFCETNYKIKFPLFNKNKVVGPEKQPIYKFLTESGSKDLQGEVSWNFEKFLVDKKGTVVARFKSKVTPTDEEFIKAIEKQL